MTEHQLEELADWTEEMGQESASSSCLVPELARQPEEKPVVLVVGWLVVVKLEEEMPAVGWPEEVKLVVGKPEVEMQAVGWTVGELPVVGWREEERLVVGS